MRRAIRMLLVGVLLTSLGLPGYAAEKGQGYTQGRYALEIDGALVGWVEGFEGGNAQAEVIGEKSPGDRSEKKHIGNVKYEEITVRVGTGMSKAFYNWVKDSLDGKPARKNGAIIAADFDFKERHRMTFTNALLTEVSLPALDASSKDPAHLTIKLQPESTRRETKTRGKPVQAPNPTKNQKQWLPANFRLKIDGLEQACTRVNKIEALTIRQKVMETAVGGQRNPQMEPGKLEFPNLALTLSEVEADPFYDWHEAFVIRGENGDDKEKGGTLEYLAPDLKTVLFQVSFRHLGIFRLAPDKAEAGAESIRRVKAEMYMESLSLTTLPAN